MKIMRKIIFTQLLVIAFGATYAQKQEKIDSKLGNAFTINYGVSDMNKAISFYEQFNYKVLDKKEDKALISDGTLLIYLQKGNAPTQELTYYNDNPERVAAGLKAEGIEATETQKGHYVIKTAEGFVINLVKTVKEVQQPAGKNLITMSPADHGDPSKYPNQKCGAFGEYAIPVPDLDKSMAFLEKLGFKSAMKEMQPYPHAILTDGLFIIGLHEKPAFSGPGLTYFSIGMADRIKRLKSEGLKDGKALDANNEIFKSPDGQAIFLFSL
jgi:predicted lactoylglutathione lyase